MAFQYYKTNQIIPFQGKKCDYLDLSGNIKQSNLGGNGKRCWLLDVACHPYADTVLIKLPIMKKLKIFTIFGERTVENTGNLSDIEFVNHCIKLAKDEYVCADTIHNTQYTHEFEIVDPMTDGTVYYTNGSDQVYNAHLRVEP